MRSVEADRKRFDEVIAQPGYDEYIEFVGDTLPEYFDLVEEMQNLVLQFVASLTLCDHLNDVGSDLDVFLKRLGYKWEWRSWYELRDRLAEMGITTLYGTPLSEPFRQVAP